MLHYLQKLPGAMKEEQLSDGRTIQRCIYTPHSLRATTITDLLEQGVPLEDVQRLAGHSDPRTTRLYDRRDRKITPEYSRADFDLTEPLRAFCRLELAVLTWLTASTQSE